MIRFLIFELVNGSEICLDFYIDPISACSIVDDCLVDRYNSTVKISEVKGATAGLVSRTILFIKAIVHYS